MKKKRSVPVEPVSEMASSGKKSKMQQTDNSADNIPDYVFESLARCALPLILAYYETEEGRRAYEEWKAKRV